jgi:zinc protease
MKSIVAILFSLYVGEATSPAQANMTAKRMVLDNGLILLTSEQRALPMVAVELVIDAGSRHEPAGQAGLANLTAKLLTYGTKKRNALQISESLDFVGASLSAGAGENSASISMTLLKKDLAAGLELLADILTASTFPQPEIDRQKQSVIAAIRAQEEDPGAVAGRAFAAALFPQSPYGRPVEGTEASVKNLQAQSLKEFYARYYRPNRAIMAVVGAVSEREISQALNQALRGWSKGTERTAPPPPSTIGAPQTIRLTKELTQANIILGHGGVPRNHPDYYAIQVMNYILGGGGFSSRAMDSIRNERGLAYSVYSFFAADQSHGSFQFVMQTKNESAGEAIRLAHEEIRKLRDQPVREAELSDAKNYLIGSFPLRFDTNRRVAGFLAQIELFGLGLDFASRYGELIGKVSAADVQRVARQFLQPDKLITVIVGDQKRIAVKSSF